MSERIHTPRSGGRAAEPQRGATGRRNKGLGRDADAQDTTDRAASRRSAARGARHFADEDDTRRSGIAGDGVRGNARDAVAGRPRPGDTGSARDAAGLRGRARDTDDGPRAQARGSEAPRSRARDAEGARGKARDADGVRGKARETGAVRGRAGERDRNPAAPLGRSWNAERVGRREASPVGRDRKGAAAGRRSRMADALGGRRRTEAPVSRGGAGRRPVVDAPVDGTAALDIEVTSGEPLRVTEATTAPRLRVAPPAPISAPRAPFVAAVLSVVVVGVLGILVINTKTNENSFRITDLQKQNTALENRHQDLENQLVAASSIGNLDAAARRLGMVKASKMALFRLPDGKVIGVPTPTDGEVAVTAQDPKTGTADKDAGNVAPAPGTVQEGTAQNGTGQNGTAQQGQPAADGTGPGTGQAPVGQQPAGIGR